MVGQGLSIHVVPGKAQVGASSLLWRDIFAWIGAMVIGATAWTQITIFAEPLRPVEALRNGPQPALTATKQEGDLYLVR